MRTIEDIKADIKNYKSAQKYTESCCVTAAIAVTAGLCELKDELRLALTDDIPLDRLEEIMQAEKEGRCVLMLCKIGDKAMVLSDGELIECILQDSLTFKAVSLNLEIVRHMDGMLNGKQTVFPKAE
jgi:hypothetical protein